LKVLIVGSGAREHALAWKVLQNKGVDGLFVAPGNGGTATIARNLDIKATSIDQLIQSAKDLQIDLTIIGPEIPLELGIVDRFKSQGLAIFGPSKGAAQIESSKVFSKNLMEKYGIPTAQGKAFTDPGEAMRYIQSQSFPIVIKADGLAAGKGVIIASNILEAQLALDEIMAKKVFGSAGNRVLIEEYLVGKEVSLLSFTDGKNVVPLVPACDYKRVFDSDLGPNTGGMGSYSPPGFFESNMQGLVIDTIVEPTIAAMSAENVPYTGVLYTGLMMTDRGPKVLEYNARFGDPETQAILPRLKTDLVDIMLAILSGKLASTRIEWSKEPCLGVVMTSGGYPGGYKTGYPINGLDKVDKDILVFHAGTKIDQASGKIVTDGGRVLTVTSSGKNMAAAMDKVYRNIKKIEFEGCHYRNDIARREVK
jgi:phosphoribosylamine---glycine ligase